MKKILIKTPDREISLVDLCTKEYQKINNLMNLIEREFDTDMNMHPSIRHEILDISNFIRRVPAMVSEVVR